MINNQKQSSKINDIPYIHLACGISTLCTIYVVVVSVGVYSIFINRGYYLSPELFVILCSGMICAMIPQWSCVSNKLKRLRRLALSKTYKIGREQNARPDCVVLYKKWLDGQFGIFIAGCISMLMIGELQRRNCELDTAGILLYVSSIICIIGTFLIRHFTFKEMDSDW